jgi:hypothetical protein
MGFNKVSTRDDDNTWYYNLISYFGVAETHNSSPYKEVNVQSNGNEADQSIATNTKNEQTATVNPDSSSGDGTNEELKLTEKTKSEGGFGEISQAKVEDSGFSNSYSSTTLHQENNKTSNINISINITSTTAASRPVKQCPNFDCAANVWKSIIIVVTL